MNDQLSPRPPLGARRPDRLEVSSSALLGLLLDPDLRIQDSEWKELSSDDRAALEHALGDEVPRNQVRLRVARFEGRVVVALSYSDPSSDATMSFAVECGRVLATEK